MYNFDAHEAFHKIVKSMAPVAEVQAFRRGEYGHILEIY